MTAVRPEVHEHGDDLPATDASALERLKRFGGQKLLGNMAALFLLSAPDRIATARTGLSLNEASVIEQALHALKSSSAQLGALRMQRMCEDGERLAKRGEISGMAELLLQLDAEFHHVRDWLEAQRATEHA
jgi:two-component system, sensor histidine kinase and response regulator